ncbi:MAG: radical SAM protein [bacterium]
MKSKYTYGPVPSRRLGFSLGVDIIPFKNCTFNCIYCQLGKTTNITLERKEYTPIADIIEEIKDVIDKNQQIDYITFSGSGEPTLHLGLGKLINETKKLTTIPVAVLTNSSLINISEVRVNLTSANVVLPTLCAASDTFFNNINRGHPDLSINSIIQGLIDFRESYTGNIWLEIMLVKGINDQPQALEELRRVVNRISPDKIHLNTVVRPPSENTASPLSIEELKPIQLLFGEKCEIIADFKKEPAPVSFVKTQSQVINLIKRRPVTMQDIKSITGLSRHEIVKHIDSLIKNKKIRKIRHSDRDYYEIL